MHISTDSMEYPFVLIMHHETREDMEGEDDWQTWKQTTHTHNFVYRKTQQAIMNPIKYEQFFKIFLIPAVFYKFLIYYMN